MKARDNIGRRAAARGHASSTTRHGRDRGETGFGAGLRVLRLWLLVGFLTFGGAVARAAESDRGEWAAAQNRPEMTAEETRVFLRRLCDYLVRHHLKINEQSAQAGMLYEYQRPAREGQFGEWIQSETGDTMSVGAWFGVALADAWRATGDSYYRDQLTRWTIPFYLRLVNGGGRRFERGPDAAAEEARLGPDLRRDFLQPSDAGFVPFWWDDGQSLGLEMARKGEGTLTSPGRRLGAPGPNRQFRLNGYSLLTANRLSESVALLFQQAWLVAQESAEQPERSLVDEVATGAARLQASRARHGEPEVLMVSIADALMRRESAKLLAAVPAEWADVLRDPVPYWEALRPATTGSVTRASAPVDRAHYRYYASLPGAVGLAEPVAWRIVLDAFTGAQTGAFHSDDLGLLPGMDLWDRDPLTYRGGRPEDYRSDRQGRSRRPRAVGGRRGPELMVMAGWALQAMAVRPGLWEALTAEVEDTRVPITDDAAAASVPLRFTGLELTLGSSPTRLRLRGRLEDGVAPLVLRIQQDANRTNAVAVLEFWPTTVRVLNARGEELVSRLTFEESQFDLEVPYTLVKGQKPWMNAAEWARTAVEVAGDRRPILFASEEARVKAALRRQLSGGLRVWEAVFDGYGHLPAAIGAGEAFPKVDWEELSDAGLYAQLMRACVQWLYVLEGKRDWEQQRVPAPELPPEAAGAHGTRL